MKLGVPTIKPTDTVPLKWFDRDMFLTIDSQINWEAISRRKKELIRKSNEKKNPK